MSLLPRISIELAPFVRKLKDEQSTPQTYIKLFWDPENQEWKEVFDDGNFYIVALGKLFEQALTKTHDKLIKSGAPNNQRKKITNWMCNQ